MNGDAERRWRAANWPTPEWGWDALPDDEKRAWSDDQHIPHDPDTPHTRRIEALVAALEHRIQPIPTTTRQEQS